MINILYFLTRYGGILAFVVLEVTALYLIVRYNHAQKEIWVNSSQYYSGVLLEKTTRIREYSLLLQVSDSLASENARLYTRLYDQLAQASPSAETDSVLSSFDIIPARIIKNSIHLPNNNLTLDKGAADGIAEGMGVILTNGVLGIVRTTSTHFCRVMSILNTRTQVSASIPKSGAFGLLSWDSKDPKRLIMLEVPKHILVHLGDTVVTSGHSAIFPAGIPIGVIENHYIPSGSSSLHIEISLFADLASATRGYIVRNQFWEEIQQLEANE